MVPSLCNVLPPSRLASIARLAAWLALAALPSAQVASDPEAVFVPGDRVPLSEFVLAPMNQATVLHVHPDVLNGVSSPIRVCLQPPEEEPDGGSFTEVVPSAVDTVAGTVTFTPNRLRRAVVVTESLLNDFPVVTHWEDSLNSLGGLNGEPRGGQCRDGTDGISTRDWGFDPSVPGATVRTFYSTQSDAGPWPDPSDTSRTLLYGTNRYALFSDGTETTDAKDGEVADQDVPAYERYIAENWTLGRVTNLAAIRLSDLTRETTGRPIAHRNPTPAFELSATPPCDDPPSLPLVPKTLEPGLPILQVVHAYIVDYDDATIEGSESCLATFVVPPMWVPAEPAEPVYTVLLSSVYDIHASIFAEETVQYWMRSIGELADEGTPVVGIVTNGGGATASLSQQRSLFASAEQLFDEALDLLSTDRERVVAFGLSRGATAVIGLSGNPFHDAFTAQYVSISSPTTHPGESWVSHSDATYGLIRASVDIFSGYVGSWFPGDGVDDPFEAPSQLPGGALRTGPELAMETIYGTSNPALVDTTLANAAPGFVNELARKGTRMIVATGTHDHAKPFAFMTRYYDALQAAEAPDPGNPSTMIPTPVPTRFLITYRAGHGGGDVAGPDLTELLRRVDAPTLPDPFASETGVFHQRYETVADAQDGTANVYDPDPVPLVLEAPIILAEGEQCSLTVAGPPGMEYIVGASAIDPGVWGSALLADLDVSVPTIALAAGVLTSSNPQAVIAGATHQFTSPAPAVFDPTPGSPGDEVDNYLRILYVLYTVPNDSRLHVATKAMLLDGLPVTPTDLGLDPTDVIDLGETSVPLPLDPNDAVGAALHAAPVAVLGWPVIVGAFAFQAPYGRTAGFSTDNL